MYVHLGVCAYGGQRRSLMPCSVTLCGTGPISNPGFASSQLSSPSSPPVTTPRQHTGVIGAAAAPGFLCGSWVQNSGPHASAASAPTTFLALGPKPYFKEHISISYIPRRLSEFAVVLHVCSILLGKPASDTHDQEN